MNQTALIINDIPCDLAHDTVIAITKQVNDIAELKDRQADYSTQFKLPYTQVNRQLINGANIFQSSTRTQYRKLPAKLLQNGVESLGYIAVVSATSTGFECVFYSGNLNFFSIIQGKKLSDLDLSSAEHAWTCPNVFAARLHQWNIGGYIYPIVDTVNDGIQFNYVDSEIDFRWLTPWLFVKFIWQAIFDAAGFEYEGKFLSSKKFENAITNLETNVPKTADDLAFHTRVGSAYFNQIADGASEFIRYDNIVVDAASQADATTLTGATQIPIIQAFKPALDGGLHSFEINVDVQMGTTSNPSWNDHISWVEVGVYDANAASISTPSDRLRVLYHFDNISGSLTFPHVIKLSDVALTTDEVVCVTVVGIPAADGEFRFPVSNYFRVVSSEYSHVVPGLTWKIQENLYDMEQSEFIKGIMQRFCLTCDTDPYLQKVKFYQFSEVIDNIPNARDWSEKLNQKSKVSFRDNTYGQNNFMRWTQSKEYEDIKEWGDASFPIDDEILTLKKDVLTLKFVSSKRVIRMYGRYMPCVVFYDPSVAPKPEEWGVRPGPRLLILDRDSFTPPITLLDPIFSTPQTFVTDIPMAYFKHDTLDDLTWEDGIENEYADLIKALQLYKKADEEFYLKPTDVSNFDFSIPIYVSKYSSYFYVNKISNFVAGKPVTVELFKIT